MGYGEVAEAEGEGFGAAAAFDELGELELDDVEAGVEEAGGEFAGDFSGEDGAAEVEGAAGHVGGVVFGDGDAAVGGVGALDGGVGGGVEGPGVVEEVAAAGWIHGPMDWRGGEAGVEVVEAGVGEVERGDGDVPGVGYMAVGGAAGANAVGGPESGALFVERYIAFAFEGGFARGLPEEEALVEEPAAEVGGFGAALRRG